MKEREMYALNGCQNYRGLLRRVAAVMKLCHARERYYGATRTRQGEKTRKEEKRKVDWPDLWAATVLQNMQNA